MSKQPQKKFKASDGEPKVLDSSRTENSLWLVKLPAYIADRWSKASQDEIIGNFIIGKKNGKRELYVQIPKEEGNSAAESVPDMLVLGETGHANTDGSDSMIVFSKDNKKDNHFRIDGKVTKRFNMKAVDIAESNKIINARNKASSEKQEIQLASIAELEQSRNDDNLIGFGASVKVEMRRHSNVGGSTSLSEEKKEELRNKFLVAFAKTQFMKKDQILTACLGPNVSQQDIQGFIDHFTKFHSSGRYKDHYELKSEFK